jgi:hypothetical protein
MDWITGEPREANWYLAAFHRGDDEKFMVVQMLWFNLNSLEKWWIGDFGDVKPFGFRENITHWMEIPRPPAQ